MIHRWIKYKIDILSRDEFDKGERKFLNFGHTFGHALESTSEP
jgi:3-dehydroquinate synthetase